MGIAADKAIQIIYSLPEDKLIAALHFLEYLSIKEELEASNEIMNDPDIMEMIYKSDQDLREKRLNEFITLENLDEP